MIVQKSNSQTFKGHWVINSNTYQTDTITDRSCWDSLLKIGNNTILDRSHANRIKNLIIKKDPPHGNDEFSRTIVTRQNKAGEPYEALVATKRKGQRPVNPNPPNQKVLKKLNLLGNELVLSIQNYQHLAKIINSSTGKEILRFSCLLNPINEQIQALGEGDFGLDYGNTNLFDTIFNLLNQSREEKNHDQ